MLALLFLLQSARAETFSAEATMQTTPAGTIAPGLGVRVSDGSPFLSAEARSFGTQRWVGRATLGLDVFGRSDLVDLTVGAFAGGTGPWSGDDLAVDPAVPAFGFELGLGGRLGPLHARYRLTKGANGPLRDALTENELRIGVRMLDTVELFGQYVAFDPGAADPVRCGGAGVALTF